MPLFTKSFVLAATISVLAGGNRSDDSCAQVPDDLSLLQSAVGNVRRAAASDLVALTPGTVETLESKGENALAAQPQASFASIATVVTPIEPFGREDTAQELQQHSARTQDTLVDAVENAEVAEIKRAVFRSLTRLRAAQIKEFDTIARMETQSIDGYSDAHHYRSENPIEPLSSHDVEVSDDKLTSFHDTSQADQGEDASLLQIMGGTFEAQEPQEPQEPLQQQQHLQAPEVPQAPQAPQVPQAPQQVPQAPQRQQESEVPHETPQEPEESQEPQETPVSQDGATQIAPFGREDTAQELQDHAARTQNTLVDAVENAEIAEIKRAVFRSLTRLRAAEIKEFDTIARLETQAIDEYNDAHHYRSENPIQPLSAQDAEVSDDKLTSFHE